jgi:hypothetical protein
MTMKAGGGGRAKHGLSVWQCAYVMLAFVTTPANSFQVQEITVAGFTVTGYQANHEEITDAGLSKYFYLGGPLPMTFMGWAKQTIMKANMQTDSTDKDVPHVHFDAETVAKGEQRLTSWKNAVVADAFAGNFESARMDLGTALHTVQDFYAHSSWVDEGEIDIAPIWDNAQLWATLLPQPAASRATCSAAGLLGAGPFTTGFWEKAQLLGLSTSYVDSIGFFPAVAKCKHGYVDKSDKRVTPGIAKDRKSNVRYMPAHDVAVLATTQYVSDIVSDINNSAATVDQKAAAVCGLLGQPLAQCAPAVLAGSYTVISGGGTVNGFPSEGWVFVGSTIGVTSPMAATFNGTVTILEGTDVISTNTLAPFGLSGSAPAMIGSSVIFSGDVTLKITVKFLSGTVLFGTIAYTDNSNGRPPLIWPLLAVAN